LDYQPKFSLPHFSDNQVYVDHLMRIMPEIKEATDCQLAKDLISASKGYRVTDTPTQLIHGDSRIGNVLFRHEKPLTFIDWDGLSIANPLLDVGDMLQSIVSELKPEDMTRFSIVQLSPVIEAYLHGAELTRNKAVFIRDALAAAQLLALGLGMRHLIDSVEDSYFTPPNKVESRYIFNIRRANEQRDVYRMLRM
jgi:aminoglycoside phosphotransferase (APT) family kinase protein